MFLIWSLLSLQLAEDDPSIRELDNNISKDHNREIQFAQTYTNISGGAYIPLLHQFGCF